MLDPLLAGLDAHYQVRDWVHDEYGTSLNGWKTVAVGSADDRGGGHLHPPRGRRSPDLPHLGRDCRRSAPGHAASNVTATRTVNCGWTGCAKNAASSPRTAPVPEQISTVNGNPRVYHHPDSEVVLID